MHQKLVRLWFVETREKLLVITMKLSNVCAGGGPVKFLARVLNVKAGKRWNNSFQRNGFFSILALLYYVRLESCELGNEEQQQCRDDFL